MRIMTYSEVRNNLKRVLDETIDDADITIIHRRDGEDAVLLGRNQYESMEETLYLLSHPENVKALAKAITQDKNGLAQTHTLIDVDE